MDNGLIFPYPCPAVQAGTGDAKPGSPHPPSGGAGGRADQAGSRRAVGVTQEGSSTGRWLSRGKGVARAIGKSVAHLSVRPDADPFQGK